MNTNSASDNTTAIAVLVTLRSYLQRELARHASDVEASVKWHSEAGKAIYNNAVGSRMSTLHAIALVDAQLSVLDPE